MAQNPYVFIVGAPRSGTTLLQRIVNAHPYIAIPEETHWIPRWYEKRIGLTPDGFVTSELVSTLFQYPKFRRLGLSRKVIEDLVNGSESISYEKFVTSVFDLYGKVCGKPLVGDKTPSYARRISILSALWPTAKFIHLIRDGRDVCSSYINWKKFVKRASLATWNEDAITTTALWWECHVRMAREVGNNVLPERYYEIRYESLVANPAEQCKELCKFLDVPYDEAMLRFHQGRTRARPGLDAKRAWLPIISGLRDWRVEMSAPDIGRFEAAAGDLLEELGYPLSTLSPEPGALEQSLRIRELFAQAISSRTSYTTSDRLLIASVLRRKCSQNARQEI